MKPVIFGLSGPVLTEDERAFFKEAQPAGYILFARNVESRTQLRALTDELRALDARGDGLPILIDQEGGRVQRMKPPEWPDFPAGERFAALYEKAPISAIEAARVNAEALALTLNEVGVTVDCLPLLDVRRPEADQVIGDRALGSTPMQVAALGRAVLEGLERGGVAGVIKHMPGHGRAMVDTHLALPVVEASTDALEDDIAPFHALRSARFGMTAHIVFTAWDKKNPATLSADIIQKVIRERIGFDGVLMTDDIDMKALSGTAGQKAFAAIAAGCDLVLDCWGRMNEMVDIAERLDAMSPAAVARLDRAMDGIGAPCDIDRLAALFEKRDALLGYA